MIRPANLGDLDPLVQLETRCFDSDRLSRRSFHDLIKRGHAVLLIDEAHGQLRGYALLRFPSRSEHARLYSIAIDHGHRSQGVGRALLAAAEDSARKRGTASLYLELRMDNHAATRLYEKMGYRRIGTYSDYYADHTDALRMAKPLQPRVDAAVAEAVAQRTYESP